MGRIGITYQDIEEAALSLQAKQKNPTVDNIRELLGTGSKSTIARLLKEWKAKHTIQTYGGSTIPIELLNGVKILWDKVQEETKAQAALYQQEADQQIENMKVQLEQALQQKQELLKQLEISESNLLKATENNQHLQTTLHSAQNENSMLMERASSLEIRLQESHSELGKLHILVNHIQNNLAHYQAATQELRQEQALMLEKQRHEYEHKLSALHQKIALLSEEKSQSQTQYEYINNLYHALEQEYKALNQTLLEQRDNYQLTVSAYQALQQTHGILNQQYQQQSESLHAKNKEAIELALMLETVETKINLIDQTLLQVQQEKEFISQEKANLQGQLMQLQRILAKHEVIERI